MPYTKRQYRVTGFENAKLVDEIIGLNQLFEDDDGTELLYSLQDELDKILDLKQFDVMFIRLSRDNPNSLGVIKRID